MGATSFPAAAIVSGVLDAARLAGGTATDGYVITADASGDPVWTEAAGGGTAWGDITGTLSDQTDLQAALDAKIAGTTGATDNRLLRSDGTGTKTLQPSAITCDDSGNLSGVGTVACGAITASGASLSAGSIGSPSLTFGTANTGFYQSGTALQWVRGGVNVLSHDSGGALWLREDQSNLALGSSADVRFRRGSTGPTFDACAAGGFRSRNLAGTADAPLTAGAIAANGPVSVGPITKAALLALTPAVGSGAYRVTDADNQWVRPNGTNWLYFHDNSIVS